MDCLFLNADCVVRLDADTSVYWLPKDGDGAWVSLQSCAEIAEGTIALVLPAEVCSSFAITLPTRKARWLNQALAYAAEELLAENVDDLHLTCGEALDDGRHRVIAINHDLLAKLVNYLQSLGFIIAAIHMDADLLPRDGTQLLFIDARGLIGGGLDARLAFLPQHWPLLVKKCPLPLQIRGTGVEAPAGVEGYAQVADPYRFLAEGRARAVNLAHGDFAAKASRSGMGWGKHLLVAFGLILLAQLGFNYAQAWYLQRQGDVYAGASRQLYRDIFPEDRRIVNIRAQFDEHLDQDSASTGEFFSQIELVAGAIAEGLPVTIRQLDYNQERRELALQVHALDFSVLEQLRQHLSKSGQEVKLGTANREGDSISARIVIGG